MKNVKPVLICFSDQDEHKHHAKIANLIKSSIASVLVNTRPYYSVEEIRSNHPNVFSGFYGWENLYGESADVFSCDRGDEEKAKDILEQVGWPQTLEEVLRSDQYAHWRISGRLYQKIYTRDYLVNSFLAGYQLALKAIKENDPVYAYFFVVRDVNKIGSICACLEKNVPVAEFAASNVYGRSFLKTVNNESQGVVSEYIGLKEGSAHSFLEITEHLVGVKNKKVHRLTTLNVKHNSRSERSDNASIDIMARNRAEHNKSHGLDLTGVWKSHIKTVIKLVLRLMKTLVNGLGRAQFPEIPMHYRNKKDAWKSYALKNIWAVSRIARSIRLNIGLLAPNKHAFAKKKFVVTLHYFPESSTISGVSWRGCKNEVELFSEPEVRNVFPPGQTVFIEHPVNLLKGERTYLFWRRLKKLGYHYFVKSSNGINLEEIDERTIVTIAGTIAIEAANKSIPVVVVKNTQLIAIDGIYRISEYVEDAEEGLIVKGEKIKPEEYVQLSLKYGLKSEAEIAELIQVLVSPSGQV